MDDQINNQELPELTPEQLELPELTPEQLESLQKAAESIGEVVHTVVDNFVKVMQQVAEKLAPALQQIAQSISDIMPELAAYLEHQRELEAVATPRQWHQYTHGRYRVRKKWEHAFEKRLQKRKGGENEVL